MAQSTQNPALGICRVLRPLRFSLIRIRTHARTYSHSNVQSRNIVSLLAPSPLRTVPLMVSRCAGNTGTYDTLIRTPLHPRPSTPAAASHRTLRHSLQSTFFSFFFFFSKDVIGALAAEKRKSVWRVRTGRGTIASARAENPISTSASRTACPSRPRSRQSPSVISVMP